jgi:hypothetical protein
MSLADELKIATVNQAELLTLLASSFSLANRRARGSTELAAFRFTCPS